VVNTIFILITNLVTKRLYLVTKYFRY